MVSGGLLNMPVVMMSGHATIDTAVEATRIGAMDFLEKPIALQKLLATVKRALGQSEPRDTRPSRTVSLASLTELRSPALLALKKRLAQAAATGTASIMLRGEQGSLPEFYARGIQQAASPWVNATQSLSEGAPDVLPQAAGVLVYVLMALILLWKPDGLFKAA